MLSIGLDFRQAMPKNNEYPLRKKRAENSGYLFSACRNALPLRSRRPCRSDYFVGGTSESRQMPPTVVSLSRRPPCAVATMTVWKFFRQFPPPGRKRSIPSVPNLETATARTASVLACKKGQYLSAKRNPSLVAATAHIRGTSRDQKHALK